MRLALALLFSSAAFADAISVGVRGGAPLLDVFNTVESARYITRIPHRWIFGPALEVRLPLAIGFTFDALYSKLEYQPSTGPNRQAGHWEFPIMLRYRFGAGPVNPFVAGGPTFNRITGLAVRNPAEFVKSSTAGIVMGAGVEIKVPKIRIAPELRYTHRLGDNFSLPAIFSSNRNQITLLLGVTF